VDAVKLNRQDAASVRTVQLMDELFAIDREAREAQMDHAACHQLRQAKAPPLLDQIREHILATSKTLAAYVCGTPIALIGFIDQNSQWFKSRVGWDVDKIPRGASLCAQTILQSEVLVVSDTLAAEQMKASPLATHGGVRFYAGVPLLTEGGYAL
jgi:GAF domain-containing protein